jgi:hypothetical protein
VASDAGPGGSSGGGSAGGRLPALLRVSLVVLGTILLITANAACWVQGTVLDSGEFTGKVSGVLRREEANQRIGDVLAQQVLASGELQKEISAALPQEAGFLPDLLGNQLQEVLARTLARLLMLDVTQEALEQAIRRLHDLVVSTLKGSRDGLDVENGALVIHLEGAISNLLEGLNIEAGSNLQDRDVGTVVLVRDAGSLDTASQLVRATEESVPWLIVATVLAFAASVALARHKARGLTVVGYGLVIAGVFSLIAWRLSTWGFSSFLDEAPVARMILESLVGNLRVQSLLIAGAGGVVIALADERIRGWLAGNATAAWSRVEAFGAGRAAMIGAVGLVVILLVS